MDFCLTINKIILMKTRLILSSSIFTFLMFSTMVNGQYDDVYYDPAKEKTSTGYSDKTEQEKYNSEVYEKSQLNQNEYDDEFIEEEDYDYYYSSRIRRFHRNYIVTDFYDPYYVNLGFYDPYLNDPFLWGNSIVFTYGGYYDPFRYRRWNRYNRFNPFWNSWDWCNGYAPYNPAFRYNYGFYDPWCWNGAWGGGYNNWGWGGYPYYGWDNGGWYSGHGNNNNNNGGWVNNPKNPKGTVFGSRRSGFTTTSRNGPVRLGGSPSVDKTKLERSERLNNINPSEAPNERATKRYYKVDDGSSTTIKPSPSEKQNEERKSRRDKFSPPTPHDKPNKSPSPEMDKERKQPRKFNWDDKPTDVKPRETAPKPNREVKPERQDRKMDQSSGSNWKPAESEGRSSRSMENSRPSRSFENSPRPSERSSSGSNSNYQNSGNSTGGRKSPR